jgi:hypothetical protein
MNFDIRPDWMSLEEWEESLRRRNGSDRGGGESLPPHPDDPGPQAGDPGPGFGGDAGAGGPRGNGGGSGDADGAGDGASDDRSQDHSDGDGADGDQEEQQSKDDEPPDLFETLLARANALKPGDDAGLRAILQAAIAAFFSDIRCFPILAAASAALGCSYEEVEKVLKKERRAERRRSDPRPTIVIEPGEIPRIVQEIEAALLASGLQIYQRAGKIVRPAKIELQTYDGKTFKGHAIEIMSGYAVREYAERAARFEKWDRRAKDYVICDVRLDIIHSLEGRTASLRLPVLSTLASCPSISAEGVILDRRGYDPKTEVLYDPLGVKFPRVPEAPTDIEIKDAFGRVNHVFHTMDADFETPPDKGVALSTLMTSVARRGLDFAPMHGMDAPVQGSGKSMVHIIAAVLLTGNFPVVITPGKTEEEFEKRLGTAHMRGDPIIVIDNVTQPLTGEYLAQSITQPAFSPRILGKSEMPPIENRHFTLPNGNNLRVKGDIPRRIVICRIDPKCAAPERRVFKFDPVAHAFANRAQLVVDILTLLKAYHKAGRPNSVGLNGFEKWSRTVRSTVIWLSKKFPEAKLADPFITNDRIREKDPELENLTSILTAWHKILGDRRVTVADVVAAADAKRPEIERAYSAVMVDNERGEKVNETKTTIIHNYVHPEFREAILDVAGQGGKINNRLLGQWLSHFEGRRIVRDDGSQLTLTRAKHLGKSIVKDGAAMWQVTVVDSENRG